jgi:hypothetical protein
MFADSYHNHKNVVKMSTSGDVPKVLARDIEAGTAKPTTEKRSAVEESRRESATSTVS